MLPPNIERVVVDWPSASYADVVVALPASAAAAAAAAAAAGDSRHPTADSFTAAASAAPSSLCLHRHVLSWRLVFILPCFQPGFCCDNAEHVDV